MAFPAAERASIRALDSKLSSEHAPYLKHKLRQALNLLDEYDKTGSDTLLQLALEAHQHVVDAIGKRLPERAAETPR